MSDTIQLRTIVLSHLAKILDMNPDAIALDARLDSDLKLDSTEMVELRVLLENQLGRKLQPTYFTHHTTVTSLITALETHAS
jgi:acyl carrier protein